MEKTHSDYNDDGARIVDLLRGTIVCEEMDDVLACFARISELEVEGVARVVRTKNRLRDGGVPGSGYRDVNMNLEFKGHICELQLQLREFYELKSDAHSVYNVVRSLGVDGELGRIPEDTQIPWAHRIAVTFLMLVSAICARQRAASSLFPSTSAKLAAVRRPSRKNLLSDSPKSSDGCWPLVLAPYRMFIQR